jgi:hypothetical protein
MLQRRSRGTPNLLKVPLSAWNVVLEFCPRDWFERELSEVDRLREQLKVEQTARQLAERRLKEVIHERDEAVHICVLMRLRQFGAQQDGLHGQQASDSSDSDDGSSDHEAEGEGSEEGQVSGR